MTATKIKQRRFLFLLVSIAVAESGSMESGWFRLFGYGLKWDTEMTFSQRNGLEKYWMIGKWCVGVLKKDGQ